MELKCFLFIGTISYLWLLFHIVLVKVSNVHLIQSFVMELDYSNPEIGNAFESSRLRYVRVDESDEDLRAWISNIVQDPVIQALVTSHVLQPKSKKDDDSYLEAVTKALLGVSIHLLPEEKAKFN